MNTFYEHHKNHIRFHYSCFDRLLLNGTIQPFQEEKRVLGFFWTYRQVYPVSRDVLRALTDFQFPTARVLLRTQNAAYGHHNENKVPVTMAISG
jgi:hypothetical protein